MVASLHLKTNTNWDNIPERRRNVELGRRVDQLSGQVLDLTAEILEFRTRIGKSEDSVATTLNSIKYQMQILNQIGQSMRGFLNDLAKGRFKALLKAFAGTDPKTVCEPAKKERKKRSRKQPQTSKTKK